MAKYRMVHTEFWDDAKVIEEMTPEDKYFFLYLLTNPNTTQIGIYQITKKQMAFDLGYSLESINSLMERFINHHQIIKYNPETREIAIKNWGKYNLNKGGKPFLDCVKAELKDVKDKTLIDYVAERIENPTVKQLYESYNESYNESSNDTSTTRPQKEKEKEKEKEDNCIRDLYNHYLSKEIIRHKKLTEPMKRAIRARLRDYSYEELKKAIDNYAVVLKSDVHWFTHKYPLADLMRDKDIRKFLDEADPLNNFRIKQKNKQPNNVKRIDEYRSDSIDAPEELLGW